MHVVVDGRFLCGLHRSMSLFSANLLRALVELDLSAAPAVLVPRSLHPSAYALREELGERVRWVRPDRDVDDTHRFSGELRWVHREVPALLARSVPDAEMVVMPYHQPPLRTPGVHRVVVLHDICGLGAGFPRTKKNYWRHYLRLFAAAHFADSIWPISHSTGRDMATRFPSSKPRLGPVVYNGVDRKEAPAARVEECLNAHGLEPRSYVVAFATWQERKNFTASLDALTLLRRQGRPVRVVGIAPESERDEIRERCVAEGHEDAVILSGIADEELDALYAGALALLWPSTCEGFGYPVVEAMAQGCPPLVWSIGPGAELVEGAIEPLTSLDPASIAGRLDSLRMLGCGERHRLEVALRARTAAFSPDAYRRQVAQAVASVRDRR